MQWSHTWLLLSFAALAGLWEPLSKFPQLLQPQPQSSVCTITLIEKEMVMQEVVGSIAVQTATITVMEVTAGIVVAEAEATRHLGVISPPTHKV